MVRKILRIITFTTLILLGILVVIAVTFLRLDIPIEELEDDYYTENSAYLEAEVSDLDGKPLNIKTHYQSYGNDDDPVIVLLHGAFSSSHTFMPWADRLQEAGYRVLLIDLPYHGLTGGFSDRITSLRRSAAVVKAVIDHLEIDSVAIGGNSMGGGVSWYFTSEYAEKDGFSVSHLVLIDAVHPEMSYEEGREGLPGIMRTRFVSGIVSQMTPKFLLEFLLNGAYGSERKPDEETVTRYYELLRRSGNRQSILRNTQEEQHGIDDTERLDTIREWGIPTLVLWGEEDTWVDQKYAYAFQESLDLAADNVLVYPGLGHVPMEEAPERTFDDLIAFLENENQ
ncbi:MAG: alpha/beta fold hydrolase [Acholeplasmataceae bacterium]